MPKLDMTLPSGVVNSDNSNGLMTDLCGTPVSELSVVDMALPTLTKHERPSRYDFAQPMADPLTPNVCSSLHTWWSMVSKPADKSRATSMVAQPDSAASNKSLAISEEWN